MIRKLFSALGALLLFAGFLFGLLMSSDQQKEAVSPVYPSKIADVYAKDFPSLVQAFGANVPSFSGVGEGSVKSVPVGNQNARLLIWEENDGFVVSAVQPASCAHLLRRDDLSLIEEQLWLLQNHVVTMAIGEEGACAYFSYEHTAFSIYLSGSTQDALLSHLTNDMHFN